MKNSLRQLIFIVTFLMAGQITLFGQRDRFKSFEQLDTLKKRKLFIKIYTVYGEYKGSLYSVGDSGVGIIKGRRLEGLPDIIAVKDIHQIVFIRKNALLKDMLEGCAAGVILGVLCAIKYYDKEYSFGENVLFGSIAGAGLGIIIGAVSKPFLRVVIPIYKSQRLFEEKKSRLTEFVVY